MFDKNKNPEFNLRLMEMVTRQMESAVHLFEYMSSYQLLLAQHGQVSWMQLMLIDDIVLYLMQLYGAPEDEIAVLKMRVAAEHKTVLGLAKEGKLKADPGVANDKIRKAQEDLKKLGIDFKLSMPDEMSKQAEDITSRDFSQPTKEDRSNVQIPKLTPLQIDKIIEMNYDKVIDLYLRRKKEETDKGPELPNV